MNTRPLLLALLVAVTSTAQAASPNLPYDDNSSLYVGIGVDPDDPDVARTVCLAYTPTTDLVWLDSDGAVSTNFQLVAATSYTSLAETLHLGIDYSSMGSATAKFMSGSSESTFSLSQDDFAKREDSTLSLVIKAESRYGRKGLRNYELKEAYKKMLDEGRHDDFRESCGTHSIIAESRGDMLAMVINITNLNASSKRALMTRFTQKVSGAAKFEVVDAKVESSLAVEWKRLIEEAKQLGQLDVKFESRGGAGIPDAVKSSLVSKASDLEALLANLAKVSESFTQANSAPLGYNVVSNSVFGWKAKPIDIEKLGDLAELYRRLAYLDGVLERVRAYRTTYKAVFDAHYAGHVKTLSLARDNVIAEIRSCARTKPRCDLARIEDHRILFIEDLITDPDLRLSCGYSAFTIKDSAGVEQLVEVLATASVNLSAKVRLAEYISIPGILIRKMGADRQMTNITPRFTQWAVSGVRPDGSVRIFGTIDHQLYDLRDKIQLSGDSVTVAGMEQLSNGLQELRNTLYTLDVQTKTGLSLPQALGFPFSDTCTPIRHSTINVTTAPSAP